MDRNPPRPSSGQGTDEIDLYIRTYYSLLRSTGDIRVRAFEEAHIYSASALHAGARDPTPDIAAFAYSAARLPACMPRVRRMVLGHSVEHFEASGLFVSGWQTVQTRGRRRAIRWDGGDILAVFITSASDIDDLIPIVTGYQIEWNKMHSRFSGLDMSSDVDLAAVLDVGSDDADKLVAALGSAWREGISDIAARDRDLSVRLLSGSFSHYQRSAQRWWSGIEPAYLAKGTSRRPVYFVSSNTHSIINLAGGYALAHKDEIVVYARERDPESLAEPLAAATAAGNEIEASSLLYYLLRTYLHDTDRQDERRGEVIAYERESGIESIAGPGRIDVNAQIIDLSQLRPDRLDPRLRVPGIERLAQSDALIVNIDYPLGLSAYHHLSRLAQGVGDLRGVYVMGKAATLNARVGDVMIPKAAYDEHSQNTYLFRNCFQTADVQPYMRRGTVLDNQQAVTVRSAFLQNRDYMSLFYNRGYTILEMETGPYLSAVFEVVSPQRHPEDELINLGDMVGFDLGFLHYASDTPYSRRQSLLSKSLSYFGVESTYACAIAILRRIFSQEVTRCEPA